MQQILTANTIALECSSRDRQITSKTREIANTVRLQERAEDDAESRDLQEQLDKLQVELARMESAYLSKCLNGDS